MPQQKVVRKEIIQSPSKEDIGLYVNLCLVKNNY